jgi:hypothetical protein
LIEIHIPKWKSCGTHQTHKLAHMANGLSRSGASGEVLQKKEGFAEKRVFCRRNFSRKTLGGKNLIKTPTSLFPAPPVRLLLLSAPVACSAREDNRSQRSGLAGEAMALQLISTGAAERVHGYPINPGGAVLKYAVIYLWNMGPSSDAHMQNFWSRACNDATQQPLSHLMDIMTAFR